MLVTNAFMQAPTQDLFKKAVGASARRDQLIDIVTARKKLSEMYFGGVRASWPRLYDLWRGTWTGRFHPHKNNVHIPLIFSSIWADAARKASTSLSPYPIIQFTGYGPDDAPIARKREALIDAQLADDDIFLKQVDFIVSADLYGRAIFQVGWKYKEETRMIEIMNRLPISGRTVKSVKKGNIVTFDGPVSEQLDLLDCFPQPGVKYLKEMKWFIRRYYLDLDDCRYLATQGIFDQNEINRMENEGGVNAGRTEGETMIRRFAVRNGMSDESIKWMDRYMRPIELLEMWGVVPSELADNGVTSRVITVANSRYLFRNNANPFWHGRLPFVDFAPTPDPHYFFAPGKAEIVEKLQIVGNRYLNQSLDAADLLIDPMWFYDRAANINTRNLFSRPGRWIAVDGQPQAVVAPMETNLQGLTVADNKIAQVREFVQMGTGIVDDAVAGLEGPDRQTAREFVGRREAAGTRLLLESQLYEKACLEPLANMFVALDKQFLEPPIEVLILGDSATFDPVTGMPIASTRETLDGFDLVPNYAARAVGASSSLTKSMKQERLMQLLQALSSPLGQAVMGQINAINFWRGIFKEFEVPNINEIFMVNPMLQQMAMQQQGGVPGTPTSGQMVNGNSQLPLPSNPGVPQDQGAGLQNTLPPM